MLRLLSLPLSLACPLWSGGASTLYSFARSMYFLLSVSILIFSPVVMNRGTFTIAPDPTLAGCSQHTHTENIHPRACNDRDRAFGREMS